MIALLPPAVLIISGVTVILLSRYRKGLGVPWLVSSAAALLAWAGMLALHWFPTNPIYLIGWNPVESFTNLVGIQLDLISWPFSFALATLILAILLTSSARIETTAPIMWGVNLITGGLGLLAVMAATPLTLILAWSMIDLTELVVLQRTINRSTRMQPVLFSYSVRLVSVFLVSIAMIISRSKGVVLNVAQISSPAGIFLFLGAVLRLGILPRHLPYPPDFRFRREFGTLLRSVQPASALVLLARMQDLILPGSWPFILRIIFIIAALYGSARWLASQNEVEARPYWVIGVSGLAMLSLLNGYQITAMVWGLVLILIGGVAGLYSNRDARIQYIPALAIVGFFGLPFTPAAGGWVGLVGSPFSIFQIFYFIIHILLVLGLARHLFRPGEAYLHLERWIRAVYPAGLVLLIFAHWIIATWAWPGSYTAGVWWASLVPLGLIGFGYYLWVYARVWDKYQERILKWNYYLRKFLVSPLTAVLRGRWLVMLVQLLIGLADYLIGTLNRLLEGEGGILWVMLLLAMLVTFVISGGAT